MPVEMLVEMLVETSVHVWLGSAVCPFTVVIGRYSLGEGSVFGLGDINMPGINL
jgi:hypothetical protein